MLCTVVEDGKNKNVLTFHISSYLGYQCQGPSVSQQSQDKFLLLLRNLLAKREPHVRISPLCVCVCDVCVCVCVCAHVCVCV